MPKRKAMSTEQARKVRAQGHLDALEFAKSIGLHSDYQNNAIAKKDVVDHHGDTHSVKSGTKRWQIFLYGKNRFESDNAFQSMNGIGQILISCIELYPKHFLEYQQNKHFYKEQLRMQMRLLKEKFSEKRRLKSFLSKSIFNGNEVNYLTVKHDNKFHVFENSDVINVFGENFEVVNSQAKKLNETPELKVLFRYNNLNVGELEMRNSGENHFREVLFVMNKLKALTLLFEKINNKEHFNDLVILYGNAIKKFKIKPNKKNKF